MNQTIFALASAQGRAGIAVIRLSGPKALQTLQHLTSKTVVPRRAVFTPLIYHGQHIDDAVVVWFAAPHSFTGEDCVELHVHGSAAVLEKLYVILNELGLRLANAGEFSRRALENGKLDLTQVEAIADLVDAESESQRQQALRQLGGGLSDRYETWRVDLIDILARIEVYIDFPDEDLPQDISDGVLSRIGHLRDSLQAAVIDSQRGRQIREGFRIVILGAPNAGKSSLFNALLRSEAAIVTPIAGTTRDVIEAQLKLGPYTVLLYDTAGLRETEETVEAEGIRRALAKAVEADLRIWVVDSACSVAADISAQAGDIIVLSKIDQLTDNLSESSMGRYVSRETQTVRVSILTGQGIDELFAVIETVTTNRLSMQTFPAATRARHVERLEDACEHLERALDTQMRVPELTAEHVRAAVNSFEALFGRYDVEGVLDVVFTSFCIGK